jgi:hypothetical protein
MEEIYSAETQLKFHRSACCLLHPVFSLGLLFHPEDGSDMFFQNVG